MRKGKRRLVTVLAAVCAAAAGIAGGYFYAERSADRTEETAAAAENDFTQSWTYLASEDGGRAAAVDYAGSADAYTAADGTLYVPDNITALNVSSARVSARGISFSIPGCWADRVTVRTLYYDDTGAAARYNELGLTHDCIEIRFYDVDAYAATHLGTSPSLAENGILASIYVVNLEGNDISEIENSMYAVKAANFASGDAAYAVYVTAPVVPGDVPDSDYENEYMGMTWGTDYMGCIISSMAAASGETRFDANGYIAEKYRESFDEDGPGIAAGSAVPVYDTAAASKNEDSEPADAYDASENAASEYEWPAWENPYEYRDGTITVITPSPTPTPTPTPSPTPSPTPTPSAVPSPTGSAGGTPTPAQNTPLTPAPASPGR